MISKLGEAEEEEKEETANTTTTRRVFSKSLRHPHFRHKKTPSHNLMQKKKISIY
jgi:hypothetical protein